MCSLSLPWIPLCIWLLPTFLPSHCLFLLPYYYKEEEKIREGENANTGLWFFLVIDQASLYRPLLCILAQDDLLSISLSCLSPLHYEVFYLQWNPPPPPPPLLPGWWNGENSQVTKEESLAPGHKICFTDEAGQDKGIGIGGIIFMTVVRRCSISLL